MRHSKILLCTLSLLLVVLFLLPAAPLQAKKKKYKIKHHGMDLNYDGVVSREEWSGSATAFEQLDWNGDGILSGKELMAGMSKPNVAANAGQAGSNSFQSLDVNGDGVISRSEWKADYVVFERMDCNRNSQLTREEFNSQSDCKLGSAGSFQNLDANRDNIITIDEWRDTAQNFASRDCNHDNKLSKSEFFSQKCSSTVCDPDCLFRELDVNNDGTVTMSEWRGNNQTFARLDRNGDKQITRSEFNSINRKLSKEEKVLNTVDSILNSLFQP